MFPTGIDYVRQSLIVAAISIVLGLIFFGFGWSVYWTVLWFLLGLVFVILPLIRSFEIRERRA